MNDVAISFEAVSPDLLDAYAASGMARGQAGEAAIRWAFDSNPQAFAVARDAGKIVGLSANLLLRMKFGSANGPGIQAVDSYVDTRMRGRGVFGRLARAYDQHAEKIGADLVWGFPNDNAAPAWFGKLGWHKHGQVPFLMKPLRAGYFLRKAGLPLDFPMSATRDQHLPAETGIGDWADDLWADAAPGIGCATIRDKAYLTHRLFEAPHAASYRVVADTDPGNAALVVTREAEKHGGRITYLMEALGGTALAELLASEMGRLRSRGTEVVLAWAFPWSPNYRTLRKAGFFPLPRRFRPINIWFGTRPKSSVAAPTNDPGQWYLSYLDSDTI